MITVAKRHGSRRVALALSEELQRRHREIEPCEREGGVDLQGADEVADSFGVVRLAVRGPPIEVCARAGVRHPGERGERLLGHSG